MTRARTRQKSTSAKKKRIRSCANCKSQGHTTLKCLNPCSVCGNKFHGIEKCIHRAVKRRRTPNRGCGGSSDDRPVPKPKAPLPWQSVAGDGEKLQFRYSDYYDLAAWLPQSESGTGHKPEFDFTLEFAPPRAPPPRKRNCRPVQPKEPVVAAWVSSKYMSPAGIHACLAGLLAETITSGQFLSWNDNFCHFDTVLMLTLVAYCTLGMAYWTDGSDDGTQRAVSYHERRMVDLLCAFKSNSADRVRKALRNTYMWEVLSHDPNEEPYYGGVTDAMMHTYVAGCKADEYHGVKIRPSIRTLKPCQCRDGITRSNEDLRGCLAVRTAKTLAEAYRNAVLAKHNRTTKTRCLYSIPKGASSRTRTRRCFGEYTATVESVMMGAFLCIDVELGYVVNVEKEIVLLLGPLEYNLVGMALWDRVHYKCRFVVDNVWYEYNDTGHGNGTYVMVVRNPYNVPSSWQVRGLWYARTSGNCQPQEAWEGWTGSRLVV